MPEVDWKQAPKQARWWAMDANGKAHWFNEPNVASFTYFWFADSTEAPNFGFEGDWRKSLVERSTEAKASAAGKVEKNRKTP